ncbi:hypothetical protein N3K66_005056 [Trichothecium roseum]|uniref:Uncharacterized protein n=1 Tax=Trichothecium roseum TaxID=47278 RepID=A0ACC0V319_9HYPO|nr:hypothetical protein N3K66_005056 [Trichothecium roseum]
MPRRHVVGQRALSHILLTSQPPKRQRRNGPNTFLPSAQTFSTASSSSSSSSSSLSPSSSEKHKNKNKSPARPPDPLPLEGITVVSLEQAIAAPLCTRQLADQGARVIKVERPGTGDFARAYDARARGLSSHFVWVNRSKESLALDLKRPRDMAALRKLLARADVLVQNLAPGASARLGLSWEDLEPTHGRRGLVLCDISGYGEGGPYEGRKAYDLLVQGEAGFMSVTGKPGRGGMAKVGAPVADIAAGTSAYGGILAALLRRARTGRGSRVDVSMLESAAEWMGFPLYYGMDGAAPPERAGASHSAVYPYGPFATGGDDGTVMLGVQNEREWLRFCDEVLGDSRLAADERFRDNSLRSRNRDELRAIIEDAFSGSSSGQVLARLDAAGIANGQVNDVGALWEHPQLRARGRWTEVDTEVGKMPALLPVGAASGEDVRMGRVPALGEHNDKIFKELGIDIDG